MSPALVLIACPLCEQSHCQDCTESSKHKCSSSAALTMDEKREYLRDLGWSELTLDKDISVKLSRLECSCGAFLDGQAYDAEDAERIKQIWLSMHESHEIRGLN